MVKNEDKYAANDVTLSNGENVFTKPHEDREVFEDKIYTCAVKFFDGQIVVGFVKPETLTS